MEAWPLHSLTESTMQKHLDITWAVSFVQDLESSLVLCVITTPWPPLFNNWYGSLHGNYPLCYVLLIVWFKLTALCKSWESVSVAIACDCPILTQAANCSRPAMRGTYSKVMHEHTINSKWTHRPNSKLSFWLFWEIWRDFTDKC